MCWHFLLAVSGASHEVFIQRVPPLAPAGPVTHGGREGELISPYIPATAPHTHHDTPKGDIHLLPYLCPVHCGAPDSPSCPDVQQIAFTDKCSVCLEKQMGGILLDLDNLDIGNH